ncbi:RNA-binding protein [Alkalihalobacillus sp. 1P02AB]
MSIYQHFREDERSLVDQALTWKEEVKDYYKERLTDFLDPREQEILKTIVGIDEDVQLSFFGGRGDIERQRAHLAPSYIEADEETFACLLYSVEYPSKFVTLAHRDILGALMSIGLKREKFGDIIINGTDIQVILAKEVASYVEVNLTSIGKATIQLKRLPFSAQSELVDSWNERSGTISSLRLDAVLAEIYRVSRSKIEPYLTKGYVKVNWKVVENGSFQVKETDHFSVRGFGRSQLVSLDGKTKKDKWKIQYRLKV